MIIKYKGYYINQNGTNVGITTSVDDPDTECNAKDLELFSSISYHLPFHGNSVSDIHFDIVIYDYHRNVKHKYQYHNGHYAKLMHVPELHYSAYYWLYDDDGRVSRSKVRNFFYPDYLMTECYGDIDETFKIARTLWQIN